MKLSKPDVILFDIDDTLYSSASAHLAGLDRVFAHFSGKYQLKYSEVRCLFENSKRAVKLVLGQTAASHSRLLYFQRMLESIQVEDIPESSLELEEAYWSVYVESIARDDQLIRIFGDIVRQSIKIGIVTDLTAQIQMRKLIKLGVSRYINAIVTSEESGQDKPNFICFSLINEKLSPHHLKLNYWMVGDSIDKDLRGSKVELDATTFLVRDNTDEEMQPMGSDVDVVLNDIYAIQKYISFPGIVS